MDVLRKTPLHDVHRQLGAKLIDFGGWHMPVQYTAGTIKEHKAVRESVGLFDVSHMGEAYLRGPKARETVGKLTTNACESAPVGKAVYTLLCRPSGGVVDDCARRAVAHLHHCDLAGALVEGGDPRGGLGDCQNHCTANISITPAPARRIRRIWPFSGFFLN